MGEIDAVSPASSSLPLTRTTTNQQIDPDQDANAVLDELWSAQYLAPGTLCAFAGETAAAASGAPPPAPPSRPGDGGFCPSSPPSFTHALHVRFPNPKACTAFVAHPAFSAARDKAEEAAAAAASGGEKTHLVVAFEGRVNPPSLETLFRRGAEWESGVEHVMILSSSSETGNEASSAAADEFVSQLSELAESSLVGAVQSTSGRVFPLVEDSDDSHLRPTHALLTRFAAEEQLRAFLALPPVEALFSSSSSSTEENDDDDASAFSSPVKVVAWAHYSIAPPQGVTGKQGA